MHIVKILGEMPATSKIVMGDWYMDGPTVKVLLLIALNRLHILENWVAFRISLSTSGQALVITIFAKCVCFP